MEKLWHTSAHTDRYINITGCSLLPFDLCPPSMQHLTQRYCVSYILAKHPPVQRFFDLSHTHTHTAHFSPSSSSHLSISLSFFFLGWERWHLVTMATALWCDHGLIFLLTSVWSDISALLCRAKTGQCPQPPSWNKNTHKKKQQEMKRERECGNDGEEGREKSSRGGKKGQKIIQME